MYAQLGPVTMKVIVDLCVVPLGVGVHLAPYVAACEKVLTEAGLKIQLHPNGTAIEGDWGPVFAAIEAILKGLLAGLVALRRLSLRGNADLGGGGDGRGGTGV